MIFPRAAIRFAPREGPNLPVFKKEFGMPDYEFHCDGCGADFHKEMTMAQRSSEAVVCPACGASSVQQVFRTVHINTRKASCDHGGHGGGCGCGSCCHEC